MRVARELCLEGEDVVLKEKTFQIESPAFRCSVCSAEIAPSARYHAGVLSDGESFLRRDFCVACWRKSGGDLAAGADRCVYGAEVAALEAAASRPGVEDSTEVESRPAGAEGAAATEDDGSASLSLYAHWTAQRPDAPDEEAPRLRFDAALVLPFFRRLHDEILEARARDIRKARSREPTELDVSGSAEVDVAGLPGGPGAPAPSTPKSDPATPKSDLAFVLALLLIRKKMLSFESSALVEGREWLRLSARDEPETELWVENPELDDSELERVRDELGRLLHMRV